MLLLSFWKNNIIVLGIHVYCITLFIIIISVPAASSIQAELVAHRVASRIRSLPFLVVLNLSFHLLKLAFQIMQFLVHVIILLRQNLQFGLVHLRLNLCGLHLRTIVNR